MYDDPKNLFVAKFLGTPPINVFSGKVAKEKLWIGSDCIMEAKGVADGEVYVAIRPEGFVLSEEKNCQCMDSQIKDKDELHCTLQAVEVMGRDISVVATHPLSENTVIRAIISSETKVDTNKKEIGFELKKNKVFIFSRETEERIFLK